MKASTETIEYLIKNKAKVNLKNDDGKTALMYAVDSLNPEIVHCLLKAGADTGIKDTAGKTALDHMNRTVKEDIEYAEGKYDIKTIKNNARQIRTILTK